MNSELTAFSLIATDILERRVCVCGPRNDRSILPDALGGWDRIQRVANDRGLCPHVLEIENRRLLQHRYRILDRPDLHLGINGCYERRRQLDAFAPESAKPRKRERDGVGPWPQIYDPVETPFVRDNRTDLLDQRGACRFHRYPGHDRSRCVPDDSRNRGPLRSLRPRGNREHQCKRTQYD